MEELGFITYDMLLTFTTLITIVFMVVEFSKEARYIKSIKTKYYSAFVAFLIILLANAATGSFEMINVPLYGLSSIVVSLTGNGLADFNSDKLNKK